MQRFVQRLVAREGDCAVTLLERTPLASPMRIGGTAALDPGAPAVWFTFAEAWHDIGRFHTSDGRFTGLYANVLTPVDGIETNHWRTLDLFLDIWIPADGGAVELLDGDELDSALAAGNLDAGLAARARHEADRLLAAVARGEWPPAIVQEWPLHRALAAIGHSPP